MSDGQVRREGQAVDGLEELVRELLGPALARMGGPTCFGNPSARPTALGAAPAVDESA